MTWLTLLTFAFAAPEIVDWPIPFEQKRKELTLAYLKEHSLAHPLSGELERDVRMIPRVIVLHWTGGGSASSAWHTFAAPTLSGRTLSGRCARSANRQRTAEIGSRSGAI